MRVYKTVAIKKQELDEVICNLCGDHIKKDAFGNFEDYLEINKTWGYASNRDGETHRIDICQKCFEKLIQQFKLPVS